MSRTNDRDEHLVAEQATRKAPPRGDSVIARSVGKRFDNGVVALEHFDLEVKRGEFISIVGPSGCGKSTFLRLVAGLADPSEGAVELHGSEVSGPRQDVGLMFQRPTLLPWKTALENVLLPKVMTGDGRRRHEEEARSLLQLVGLKGFEHVYPSQLSGGMQQRVALARLLIMGVDVLLLDEPFAAVDELTRERLNVEVGRIHSQLAATVVLVTHNIGEAVLLADRVITMSPRPGRIADILEVDLPRPRTLEHTRESAFQDAVYGVRRILERFDTEEPAPMAAAS